jgi:Raf kinase inhibitor-like YbhB/YbcL family protein
LTFQLTTTAFHNEEAIPQKYTGDGENLSPPLRWTDPPAGTASLALVCEDPDAPRGTFTHWVLYNLPAETRELSEGVTAATALSGSAAQGTNDFGMAGYGGPAPPPGKPHRYVFKLFALDGPLPLRTGATRAQLLDAIKGHVLAEGQVTGTYGRPGRASEREKRL